MAAYTQFGYGSFPSSSQLLSTGAATQVPHAGSGVGGVNEVSNANQSMTTSNTRTLSPTGGDCHTSQPTNDVSSGALSPDELSQNSNVTTGAVPPQITATGGGSGGSLEGRAHGGHNTPASGSSCCENGRPIMTDPVSGQTVCSCQYDSARLALSSYSRLPAASVGVYGTPYPSTDQNPYQSIGVDSSAFYSPLSNPYALKDSTTGSEMGAWTSAGLQPTTGYYSYDPMSAYGYGASYDLAARRKNATRESTATLKTWLNEHKKNPYPTKGEKIMLAIITKMTLTQVSTWFANARRRLKKENKMTWEPKNRTDDDDDAMASEDEKEKDDQEANKSTQSGGMGKDSTKDDDDLNDDEKVVNQPNDLRASFGYPGGSYHGAVGGGHLAGYHPYHPQHPAYFQHQQAVLAASYNDADNMGNMSTNGGISSSNSAKQENNNDPKNQLSRDCGVPIPATKPKIWSLADTVACKTPPPAYMGQGQHPPQQHLMQQQQAVSYAMGANSLPQPPSQQQQLTLEQHPHSMQQQQPLPQHSMMTSSFSGAAPYSRAHTNTFGGFLGATTQQLHTTNPNIPYSSTTTNNNHSNHNTGLSNNTHTPTILTTANTSSGQLLQAQQPQPSLPTAVRQTLQHQEHLSHAHLQSDHVVCQRAMGFLEAQPDTPPQTPPNMKLASAAGSSLLSIGSQVPMTGTCRSTNLNVSSIGNIGGGVYPMNFSTRFNDYSPRDDSSSGSSSCSSSSPQLHNNETLFKPHFKREQISVAEFVPPV